MTTHVRFTPAPLVALALAALLAACGGAAGGDSVASTSSAVTEKCGESAGGPVQGVDVSEYQGAFDWSAAHVQFGYARISDGAYHPDSEFDGNWSRMKSAGVLRGAYQFFEPAEDEVTQANMMVSKVGHLGEGDLPAMIDVEISGGLGGSTIGARVLRWLQIVEAGTGLRPIIYTGAYFWEDDVGTDLKTYPIWIAAYGASCPSLPDDGWSNWTMWQYSDGGGSLDHDVFNGTLSQLNALSGAPSGPPTAKPKSPTGCDVIEPGEGLAAGESFKSCDGRLSLKMQTDGNLVLYLGPMALWVTGTGGTDGYAAVMQSDGNFVLYGSHSDALWATHTNGHAGSTFHVETSGDLVVYEPDDHAIWASNSSLPAAPPAPTACDIIQPGQGLVAGHTQSSCDGRFSLSMQEDGNLVLYEEGKALWATGTNQERGYEVIMQDDGNFVLHDIHDSVIWATHTNAYPGSNIHVQNDGNLVIYEPSGHVAWASNTGGH
jgi:GH25 family lysozyme M1 (1,4-beta-N-acetylmuramidase)